MYTVEKFKNDAGQTMARISLQSNTLPYVSIDTYQSFTGDSWLESELEWLKEDTGVELDWSNHDVKYDHAGIRQGLAEASIESIMDQMYDGIVESIEYESSWSPQYYNFETDSYTAEFVVNWTLLKKWLKKSGKDREDWMRERWSSYDGFHSHMYPGYWNEPRYMEGMRVYATIAMYLEEVLDEDEMFMHVAEAEHEVYQANSEITIPESKYEELMAAHVAETIGDQYDTYVHDALPQLLEARGETVEVLMEKYPLNPHAAANELMERADARPIPGQEELL